MSEETQKTKACDEWAEETPPAVVPMVDDSERPLLFGPDGEEICTHNKIGFLR